MDRTEEEPVPLIAKGSVPELVKEEK